MKDFTALGDTANGKLTDFVTGLAAQGVTLAVRNGRLWVLPATAFSGLTTAQKEFIRDHREELKTLARAGGLPPVHSAARAELKPARPARRRLPAASTEPEPVVFAWRGRRVTEDDVVECLTGLGDRALADYRSGELSKREAFDMARAWLREIADRHPFLAR